MHMHLFKFFLFLLCAVQTAIQAYPLPPAHQTFTVTNTDDSGLGSLREAILLSNATVVPPEGRVNYIVFNIPGTGPFTIQPLTVLPPITNPILIDGYTQPGAAVNTLAQGTNAVLQIILNGNNYQTCEIDPETKECVGTGLHLQESDINGSSIIRGLVINQWKNSGLLLSYRAVIIGNFLGTDALGNVEMANGQAIYIFSSGSQIGTSDPADRNLIAGNLSPFRGAIVLDGTGSVEVKGNLIGLDSTGTKILGNMLRGIVLIDSSNTQIGGESPAESNVLAGFTRTGILLNADGSIVSGNFIGTDASGEKIIESGNFGISDEKGLNNIIRKNVINGCINGIAVLNSQNIKVELNHIGTDISGTKPLGNKENGLVITGEENIIQKNVISSNGRNGILIIGPGKDRSKGAIIMGNKIGVDVTGTKAMGNGDNGIQIGRGGPNPALHNRIGDQSSFALYNIIAGNKNNGILVTSFSSQNEIDYPGNFFGSDPQGNPIPNGHFDIDVVMATQKLK